MAFNHFISNLAVVPVLHNKFDISSRAQFNTIAYTSSIQNIEAYFINFFMRNFFLLLLFFITYGCTVQNNANQKPIARSLHEIVADYGTLDSNTVESLRVLIQKSSSKISYDTLLIRYDFNNEKCWTYWETQPDEHLLEYLSHRYLVDDSIGRVRKRLGYFRYREPGNGVPKFVSLNSNVRIDSTYWLQKNIIQKQGKCGTSVMIFPDHRFLRIYDDPHDELLFAKPERLMEIIQAAKRLETNPHN